MITIEKLTKIYTTDEIKTTALNSISLNVERGSFLSIMGPSGSGKSTLLNILGLVDTFDSGSFAFDGHSIQEKGARERFIIRKKNIAYIFQSFNLIPELTVFQNVELPLIYGKVHKKDRKERTNAILNKLRIFERRNHYPHQLSGGQQQRVAVARACIIRPQLILADEPTGNLDSKNGIEVMELLTRLHVEGNTIIMVTHSDEYAEYAQQKLTLLDGEFTNSENRSPL